MFLNTCPFIMSLIAREICHDPTGTNRDEVHQLAFRGTDVDWQLWVTTGNKPLNTATLPPGRQKALT